MILFLTTLYIIILFHFKTIKIIKKKLLKKSVYISNREELVFSFVVVVIYVLFFVIFYRFFRFFVNKNVYFNFLAFLEISYNEISSFNLYNIILIVLIFFLASLNLKKLIFGLVRFHYLRLHYYYLMRLFFFRKAIVFCSEYKLKLFFFLRSKFKYFIFAKSHFIKFLAIVFLLYSVIKHPEKIYIGWLPLYALYFFIISVLDFATKLREDFERGSLQLYYPNNFCLTKHGLDKIKLYQILLVLNESEQKFEFQFENNLLPAFCYENKNNKIIIQFDGCEVFHFSRLKDLDYILYSNLAPTFVDFEYQIYLSIENIKYNDFIANNLKYSFF